MARHPWVAAADNGVRWGVQLVLGDEGLPRLLEAGREVEALGFDGCFIFDHPAIQADPWTCLAALAAATERVRLGSVVNCVSYRHPTMLARLATDVDTISGGRLMLGLGIGWLVPEFAALGAPVASVTERFAALEEALEIIAGVWGPEKFAYEGTHYQVGPVRITPPPIQQPRPPLMIGGSGEKKSLRLVAQYADACNVNDVAHTENGLERIGGPELIAHKYAVLRRYCDELGRPYDEILAHALHAAAGSRAGRADRGRQAGRDRAELFRFTRDAASPAERLRDGNAGAGASVLPVARRRRDAVLRVADRRARQ